MSAEYEQPLLLAEEFERQDAAAEAEYKAQRAEAEWGGALPVVGSTAMFCETTAETIDGRTFYVFGAACKVLDVTPDRCLVEYAGAQFRVELYEIGPIWWGPAVQS